MTESANLPQLVTFLATTELFRGIEEEVLTKIARAMVVKTFRRGADILEQGAPGDTLFFIIKGRAIQIHEQAGVGLEQTIAELMPCQAFGELSLLLGEQQTATTRATEDTTCALLSSEAFGRIAVALPKVSLTLARNMALQLREAVRQLGYSSTKLKGKTFNPELYSVLPSSILERHQMVPLELEGDTMVVAMTRPNDEAAVETLRKAMPGVRLRPMICDSDEYLSYLEEVIRPALGLHSNASTTSVGKSAALKIDPREIKVIASEGPSRRGNEVPGETVINLFNELLATAVSQRATAVHVEPGDEELRVRFRVEGRLVPLGKGLSMSLHIPLISRLKVLGNMNILKHRMPQNGQASFRIREHLYDMRIAVLPTSRGEKAVVRVVDPKSSLIPLEEVIASHSLVDLVRKVVLRPSGGVIVAGPTGAGKTTTLYAMVHERLEATPDQSAVTLEDPVQYTLAGACQTQVGPGEGQSYSDMLRGLIRQDPDVIMISLLRDSETAQTALESALTGQMVLGGVHAEGAVQAIMRLKELGCQPFLISHAIDLSVSQRLVRRICPVCKEESAYRDPVRLSLARAGVLEMEESTRLYRGKGCPQCHNTGFMGRVAVLEMLRLDERMREAVSQGLGGKQLFDLAMQESAITTFRQYSAFLLRKGLTVPSEILRIFGTD